MHATSLKRLIRLGQPRLLRLSARSGSGELRCMLRVHLSALEVKLSPHFGQLCSVRPLKLLQGVCAW